MAYFTSAAEATGLYRPEGCCGGIVVSVSAVPHANIETPLV